jgi:prepilin-type N-terminal cleavage/methylation domain-containing protein
MIGHHSFLSIKRIRLSGFTIVEILITVAVIAILATIGIVTYVGTQRRAASAVTVDSVRSATDAVLLEEVSKRGIPDALDTLFTPHDDVSVLYTRIVTPGGLPHYGTLSAQENGKLLYDICVDLVNQGLGQGPNDFGGGTVNYISGCYVYDLHYLQINGWNGGFNVSDPSVTEETLRQYVEAGASSNPDHPSYRATLETFFGTLISRHKAEGGTFPVTSFWQPWVGVPTLPPPVSITAESRSFCIIGTSKKYPDISYVTSSANPTPQLGESCS